MTTRMERVFNAYAARLEVNADTLSFNLLDNGQHGQHINGNQTVASLDLEDQDVIECYRV
jgi:hypothetical protein